MYNMTTIGNLKIVRQILAVAVRRIPKQKNCRYFSNIHIKNNFLIAEVTSVHKIKFSAKRLYSSNAPENSDDHKVLFINDENKTEDTVLDPSDTIEYIPPPPVPPEVEVLPLNALGEPTMQGLGLGGWTPPGMIQQALEFLHVSLDVPWWSAIALGTIFIRICIFPLIIKNQRASASLNNKMPGLRAIQKNIDEARTRGNQMEVARLSVELHKYMEANEIKPFRQMLLIFVQAPIFLSMFVGLRQCANLPVESFQTGGMMWFTDLTVTDPYYILPVVTCLTMLATIMVGSDGNPNMTDPKMKNVKYLLRGLPFITLPFMMQFPAALLCYWSATNFCSLGQAGVLRIPAIRKYYGIQQQIRTPVDLNEPKKGIKETWKSMKNNWRTKRLESALDSRNDADETRFKKAGLGPVTRTYKHNPMLKSAAMNAKSKDQ